MYITLKILDGADQGCVYSELTTPVTIGREEGNSIQLNDERVSRFHVKIQNDDDKVILTDLESTNGTKVNGDDIRLRILRHGDLIGVGRSLLLFGTESQIAARLSRLRGGNPRETRFPEDATASGAADDDGENENGDPSASLDFELNWRDDPQIQAALHSLQMPELPDRMTPGQAAQLAELLGYMHLRIRDLLVTVNMDAKEERVTLGQREWQNVLDIEARLSETLRKIGEPPDDE